MPLEKDDVTRELDSIATIVTALSPLSEAARARVLLWVNLALGNGDLDWDALIESAKHA